MMLMILIKDINFLMKIIWFEWIILLERGARVENKSEWYNDKETEKDVK